jgi:Protein of unknown function (DUF2796)
MTRHIRLQAPIHLPKLLALVWPLAAAAGPHEHGVARMNLAIDGQQVQVSIQVPLESLLGYEREPRAAAEKALASAMLERLKQAQEVILTPAAAQCRPAEAAQIKAPLIEGKDNGQQHGDLDGHYKLVCAQPAELRTLEVSLFEVSRRITRVQVQVAGPKGSSQATLRRNKRQIKLKP